MPKYPLCFVVACSLALFPSALFSAGAWTGDPEARISSENPYLAVAENNVSRALTLPKDAEFWLVWGVTARESSRRGDPALKVRALEVTDAMAEAIRIKPSTHWDGPIFLECIWLWKKSGLVPAARIGGWLAAIRPSVDRSLTHGMKSLAGDPEAGWTAHAPNALLQSASFLALAGRMYDDPRCNEMARKLVRAAGAHQLPGGAFSYIYDSGPTPIYYGFETTFLGRYYQLTQDPEAKRMLSAAAGYARDALANGPFEGSSSPWWKHTWGTGGPIHGVEIAAGVARDPIARAVAEVRLRAAQYFWFSYVAMYFWDPSIPSVAPGGDACRLSGNINGPLLRRDDWQVVMPCMPRGDTVVGATLVRPEKVYGYENYLESAALPIFLTSADDYRARDVSLFMIPSDELRRRSAIVGDGWIATGTAFHPRRAVHGETTIPASEGWEVAQVWYADADGLAGWLEAAPEGRSEASDGTPRGVLNLGAPVEPAEGQSHAFTSAGMSLAFFGDQLESSEARGQQVSVNFKMSARGAAYGVALSRHGATATLARETSASGVLAMRIKRAGVKDRLLYFNPKATAVSAIAPATGRLARPQSTVPIKAKASFLLQPYETVLLNTE